MSAIPPLFGTPLLDALVTFAATMPKTFSLSLIVYLLAFDEEDIRCHTHILREASREFRDEENSRNLLNDDTHLKQELKRTLQLVKSVP